MLSINLLICNISVYSYITRKKGIVSFHRKTSYCNPILNKTERSRKQL